MELDFRRIAERRIEEAIEEGKFDNLPGRGKPLRLDDTPAHLRILKNAGVLPDWAQLDREIDAVRAEYERLRARIGTEYPKRRAKAEVEQPRGIDAEKPRRDFGAWRLRVRENCLRTMRRVNNDILKRNLLAPAVLREHIPYRIAEEMARFDREFPPLPGETAGPEAVRESRDSALRAATQDAYQARPAVEQSR